MKRFALLMLTLAPAWAIDLPCDFKHAFDKTHSSNARVGYLTSFNGLGLTAPLAADLTVNTPYTGTAPQYPPLGAITNGQVKVVGVLENVSWNGGVGDAITISCYMSAPNAQHLKTLQHGAQALKTTSIAGLGWWVANFDQETKKWFEEMYPKAPAKMTAALNTAGPHDVRLHIADEPVKVGGPSGAELYNVHFEFVPAANTAGSIQMATAPAHLVVKPWGAAVAAVHVAKVKK
jgi:hypothetical protein